MVQEPVQVFGRRSRPLKRHRFSSALRACIGITLCYVLFLPLAAQARPKITLQLRWYHQFQFAGYYAAQLKGFYEQAGIDVEIREGRPGLDSTEYVLADQNRYGIGSTNILSERAAGRKVVGTAVLFQHSPEVLISLAKTQIKKPSDLAGKTVMVRDIAKYPIPHYKAMLIREGISPEKVRWAGHTWNYEDLIQGKVQAMSGYLTADVPKFQKRGIDIRILNPIDYGIDFYGDLLFTSEETIENDPELARTFTKASLQGWQYAFANENEIIDHILAMPEVLARGITREDLQVEAREMRKLVEPDLITIGHSNEWRWERIVEVYKRLGQLPADFSLAGALIEDESHAREKWRARALLISALFLCLGSLTLLWIYALRKQVATQTRALRDEMRKSELARLEAENASQIKSRFLANMSHEIRTPLTAILGYTELLKDERRSAEERAQYLSVISRTGSSLSTILNDILDLSKVEASSISIEKSHCSLQNLLSDVESLLHLKCGEKQIQLTFVAEGKVPETIVTDPIRLKQILLNVVGNAIKFTTRGKVEVRFGVSGSELHFRVKDTGIGIPFEEQAKLFQPFTQVDQTLQKEYGGAGLGLSISKKLAQLLGGDLSLEDSIPARGSTFLIRIAYEPGSAKQVEHPAKNPNATPTTQSLQGKRILIADDCVDNQNLVRLFLEKEGALVVLARNGEEAVSRALEQPYDLIMMDIQMPVLDGYAATTKLRAKGYSAPIVALTANAMKEDLERCVEAGCDATLPKPVKKAELIDFALRYAKKSGS